MGPEDPQLPTPPVRSIPDGSESFPSPGDIPGAEARSAHGAGMGSARPVVAPPPPHRPSTRRGMTWGRRIEKVILTIFCLQVGILLLFFPWMTGWDTNYFFDFTGTLKPLFMSPYFRGAVSGLGVLNLYLALVESMEVIGSFLKEPPTTGE